MGIDFASPCLVVVEQIDGDGQVVHYVGRAHPEHVQQVAADAAHAAGVDLSLISLTPVEA